MFPGARRGDYDVQRDTASPLVVTARSEIASVNSYAWTEMRWLRWLIVEHGVTKPAGLKIEEGVRDVRQLAGIRDSQKGAALTHGFGWRWRGTAVATRNFGERLWRPGGAIRTERRGEIRRRIRAIYRCRGEGI